jgi:hypothetical protein
MKLIARVKTILVDPTAAWPQIEKDIGDPALLLRRYVAARALVPPLAGFVGATLVGVVTPSGAIARASLFNGAAGAIFGYVMSCATVLVLGLIIALSSPLFGGQRNFNNAFKLAVYSFTPVWIAGIFLVLPGLHFLALLGCYGAYLLWLGLPLLTKTPQDQTANFTAVIVACALGLIYIAALAQRQVFGTPGF